MTRRAFFVRSPIYDVEQGGPPSRDDGSDTKSVLEMILARRPE